MLKVTNSGWRPTLHLFVFLGEESLPSPAQEALYPRNLFSFAFAFLHSRILAFAKIPGRLADREKLAEPGSGKSIPQKFVI